MVDGDMFVSCVSLLLVQLVSLFGNFSRKLVSWCLVLESLLSLLCMWCMKDLVEGFMLVWGRFVRQFNVGGCEVVVGDLFYIVLNLCDLDWVVVLYSSQVLLWCQLNLCVVLMVRLLLMLLNRLFFICCVCGVSVLMCLCSRCMLLELLVKNMLLILLVCRLVCCNSVSMVCFIDCIR